MSDLIDRQALIKSFEDELSEAKDFRDYFVKLPNTVYEQSLCNEAVKAWKLGIGIARHMPTIDAVPVVRCRDCKYGEQDEVGRWFCRSLGCQIGNEDGSGYCADAERRTDG